MTTGLRAGLESPLDGAESTVSDVVDPRWTRPVSSTSCPRVYPKNFDIEHSTFQLETTDRRRTEEASHR